MEPERGNGYHLASKMERGLRMKKVLALGVFFAAVLTGCGGDFELSVPEGISKAGLQIGKCKRDHSAASPVCTVKNDSNLIVPERSLSYTCFDKEGNILRAPGSGRFPDRTMNPGTGIRFKFMCQNSEDLGKIEIGM